MSAAVLRILPLALSAGVVALTAPALGQVAVQQPAFGTTSAATAVSVPDRGTAFVGGFGQARSARSTFGPWRRGPLAAEASSSAISASVHVHDFAAMDAAVLAAARESAAPPSHAKSRYDDATSFAMSRRLDAERRPAVRPILEPAAEGPSVADLLARRDAAERRGATGVAAIYARLAAKRETADRAHSAQPAESSEPSRPTAD